MSGLLDNQIVQTLIVGGLVGLGWLVNKITGRKIDNTAARVAAALATSSALMLQLVFTASADMTPERMIVQCKGVVAVQLAQVGITEEKRAPWQHLIDAAISAAITKWVELHPAPKSLAMPIASKIAV